VDNLKLAALRAQGRSWSQITAEMMIGKGTAKELLQTFPKLHCEDFGLSGDSKALHRIGRARNVPKNTCGLVRGDIRAAPVKFRIRQRGFPTI
jgi:hypothetical protein